MGRRGEWGGEFRAGPLPGEVAAGPSGAPESFFADLNPATR